MAGILLLLAWILVMGCAWSAANQGPDGVRSSNGRHPAGTPWTPRVWPSFLAFGPKGKELPDFSYAGYAMGDQPIPTVAGPLFDVTRPEFGAVADDGGDDTAAIQAAIDAAGAAGGGVVLLPRGRYDIHTSVDKPFLSITRSRIILRGQGSGPEGTILHLGAPAPDGRIRRLGSVPALEEARHQAAVSVTGAESRKELAAYTHDLVRGLREVGVSDAGRLRAGQMVAIEFTDPLIDPRHPAPDKADLAAQLTAPFRLVPGQTLTFGAVAKHHTWLVQVETVIDAHTIRLSKPARFDQWLRYQPRLYSFEGLHRVGIEHLRIQSSWPGGYRHHKPFLGEDGHVVRTAREQDYLWNGIWMSAAVDGWVRDVAFKNLTQGVIVSRCGQITLSDLQFHGHAGHAGITIAHSNDNLVTKVNYQAAMVHPITVSNMASGNVVTTCRTHYDGRNDRSGTDAVLDFHGLFPYENLFEALEGFYVCPGGDLSVLPHAGVRNVFWNILAPLNMAGLTGPADTEFTRSEDFMSTSTGTPEATFQHWPQAFYIGIRRRHRLSLTEGGSPGDCANQWMTVEGLNRPGIAIKSLYRAQREFRNLLSGSAAMKHGHEQRKPHGPPAEPSRSYR